MRAANVQVVPIKLSPAAKKQVAALLPKAKDQPAAPGGNVGCADHSLAWPYPLDANDVVAVQRKGANW